CVVEVRRTPFDPFQELTAAGGSFAPGSFGYNSQIASMASGTPLAGMQAWTGSSAGVRTGTINLPASFGGSAGQIRFRCATDVSATVPGGVLIDDLTAVTESD